MNTIDSETLSQSHHHHSHHRVISEAPQAVVTVETTTTTTPSPPQTATNHGSSQKHHQNSHTPSTTDSKSIHHHHHKSSSGTSSSLPRELMNLLPPPVSKAELLKEEKHSPKPLQPPLLPPPPPPPPPQVPELPKYPKRSQADERRLLLSYVSEGLDREDVAFLKRTYFDMIQQDENMMASSCDESSDRLKHRLKRIKWGNVDEMAFELSRTSSANVSMTSARTRDYSDKNERVKAKQLATANATVNKGNLYTLVYLNPIN